MAALDGVRVLDLTQYEAGTSCTQYLAWFGADVVKIEPPGGEPGRHTEGPGRDSLYFLSFNHNKRSVCLDLATPEGKEIFLRLLPRFDVVVENFTLGTMEKLGLGYDVLKEHHPAVIYATIKGFGTYGPYANFKSFDWVAQAAGGGFSVTGEPDGPPMRPGASVCDTGSGMHAAMGILAAYIQRLRTGKGQMVEIALQETMTNFMRQQLSLRQRRPGPVPRRGNKLGIPPSDLYPCAGGGPNDWAFIMVVTDRMWDSLLAAIDRLDLNDDPRFSTLRAHPARGGALRGNRGVDAAAVEVRGDGDARRRGSALQRGIRQRRHLRRQAPACPRPGSNHLAPGVRGRGDARSSDPPERLGRGDGASTAARRTHVRCADSRTGARRAGAGQARSGRGGGPVPRLIAASERAGEADFVAVGIEHVEVPFAPFGIARRRLGGVAGGPDAFVRGVDVVDVEDGAAPPAPVGA